jgi:exodeoxyribonuclease VII large subunit
LPTPDALLAGKRQLLDLASAKLKPALRHNARDHESRLAKASHALLRFSPAARVGALRTRYQAIDDRPRRGLERLVAERRKHLLQAGERLVAARDGFLRTERARIGQCREAAERVHERLAPALAAQLERKRARVVSIAQLFDSLNYKSVLARGFALVRDAEGSPVRRAANVGAGQPLAVEFGDGSVQVTAQGSEPEQVAAAPPRRPAHRQAERSAAQATLFDA